MAEIHQIEDDPNVMYIVLMNNASLIKTEIPLTSEKIDDLKQHVRILNLRDTTKIDFMEAITPRPDQLQGSWEDIMSAMAQYYHTDIIRSIWQFVVKHHNLACILKPLLNKECKAVANTVGTMKWYNSEGQHQTSQEEEGKKIMNYLFSDNSYNLKYDGIMQGREKLKKELSSAKRQIKAKAQENDGLKQRLSQTERYLGRITTEADMLKQENEMKSSDIRQLQTRLKKMKRKNKHHKESEQGLTSLVEIFRIKLLHKNEEIESLQRQLKESQNEVIKLRGQVDTLQRRLDSVEKDSKSKTESLQSQIDVLSEQVGQCMTLKQGQKSPVEAHSSPYF